MTSQPRCRAKLTPPKASSDPQLAALYREIDIRVRVELAKYDIEA